MDYSCVVLAGFLPPDFILSIYKTLLSINSWGDAIAIDVTFHIVGNAKTSNP